MSVRGSRLPGTANAYMVESGQGEWSNPSTWPSSWAAVDSTSKSGPPGSSVVENTKKVTGELAQLTANVNTGKGSVGKLMTDDAVFVEAKMLLRELRETVQDLREQAPINSFIGVVFSAF